MFLDRRQFLLGVGAISLACSAKADVGVGIIFIGASWCHVCKTAAPMLALYSETHGIPVLVASGDDRPIEPFQQFIPSSQHPVAASIQRYPTTLVFSSSQKTVVGSFEGYRDPAYYFNSLNVLINSARSI